MTRAQAGVYDSRATGSLSGALALVWWSTNLKTRRPNVCTNANRHVVMRRVRDKATLVPGPALALAVSILAVPAPGLWRMFIYSMVVVNTKVVLVRDNERLIELRTYVLRLRVQRTH